MKTYEEFINCIMKNNMARNPNWWWSMNYNMHDPQFQEALNNSTLLSSPTSLFSSQYVAGSSSLALNPYADNQDLPESWSQLLLDGLARDDDKLYLDHFQSKKLENYWEDQMLHPSPRDPFVDHVKQEISEISSNNILNGHGDEDFNTCTQSANWPQTMPVSSPRSSCVTSLSNNILDFSHNKLADGKNQQPDQSSECNSTATGGVCKKARAQSSSSQTHLMVRKEKLGDRITALHQLVSPFGKTDTASVLLEAIGYIRFL